MILFLLTAFQIVVSQVCETNSTLGLNIYPTTGSPFVMPFKNYFSGSGLQYSVTPAGLFSPYQSNTNSISVTTGLNWGNPIDSTPFNYLNDPNLQSGYYAILSQSANGYYVTIAQPAAVGNGYTFVQAAAQIQGSSTCYNIVFYQENLIVSCIQQSTLVFYIIDTNSTLGMYPLPINTAQPVSANPINTKLQVLVQTSEMGYQQTNLVVSFTYQTPSLATYTYEYSIQQGTSLSQPIILQTIQQAELASTIGVLVNSDGTLFVLSQTTLILQGLDKGLPTYSATGTTLFYDFGVYQVIAPGVNLDYLIAILTNKGVQNIYYNSTTQQFINGQLIAYPTGLAVPKISGNNQVFVNAEYVTASTGSQIVVFPSFLNSNPYFIWTNVPTTNYIINFDIRSNILITFNPNTYTQTQVAAPFLGLAVGSLKQQTGSGTVAVTATSFSGLTCSLTFAYTFVNANSPAQTTVQQLPNSNVPYSASTKQALSPFFYGNNLTYTVQTTPAAQKTTIKQVQIEGFVSPASAQVAFGQVFGNPFSNTSYLEIQQIITTQGNQLYIGYAGEDIDQLEAFKGAYGPGVILAASVGPATGGQVNIALLNQNGVINIYTVPWYTPIKTLGTPTSQIQVPTGPQFPPTISFSQIHYLGDLLYIVTSNPQSLLVYSAASSEYLFTFSSAQFIPIAVYSNPFSYGNYIFIDNQYELIVAQCLLTGCVQSQSITYSQDNTQQTIGVGLLQDGIYIAITNDKVQTIQFYPRQIIHSMYIVAPIPFTAAIPKNVQIQYPIAASFTNMKFYLAWNNGANLELAMFQPAYGINNILYFSLYISQQDAINYISAVSIDSDTSYDIIMINGYAANDAGTNVANLLELQVWNQTNVDFVPAQLTTPSETYKVNYQAVSPSSATLSAITQTIQVVDPQVMVTTLTAPPGYQNSYLELFGLVKIQPELYFDGIVQNYTASYYNTSNFTQTQPNVSQVISPITPSGVNTIAQLISASTGELNNAIPLQSFLINGSYLFQLNPQQMTKSLSYEPVAQLPTLPWNYCPLIFNTQYFLVVICSNTQGPQFSTSAFIYDSTTKLFGPTSTQLIAGSLLLVDYFQIQNQQVGVLSMQVLINGDTQVLVFEVSGTSLTVNFALVGQSTPVVASPTPGTAITVITNQYDTKRSANLYGAIITYPTSIQMYYYYGIVTHTTFKVVLQQKTLIIPNIASNVQTWIKQYSGLILEYPDSLVLAVQSPTSGGLFEVNLIQLAAAESTMKIKQLYTLQRFASYFATGLQIQGDLIVSEFIVTFQDKTQNAVVALYQIPQYYARNTILNFKAFYSEFDQPLSNVILTTNGTLVYQIGGANGAVSQLYLTSFTYLGINASQSYATVTNNGASSVASVPVLLGARNNFTSVTQKLQINIQVENGQEFVQPTDKKWFFVGFGLAFAAVIFGTIGWLCYQSRPQSAAYSEI